MEWGGGLHVKTRQSYMNKEMHREEKGDVLITKPKECHVRSIQGGMLQGQKQVRNKNKKEREVKRRTRYNREKAEGHRGRKCKQRKE